MKQTVKSALLDTLPVLSGYLVLGIGFGFLLKSSGFTVFHAFLMSLCIYAGSMQYVAVGLFTGGASLVTVAATTLMVNARHLFYGISMLKKYNHVGKRKPYLIFALTDETYSLVCGNTPHIPEAQKNNYYLLVSLFDHFYWVTGTVLGAAAGTLLQFNTEGVDFAMTALFLTVFVEQWLSGKDHFPAVIGLAASVLCLLIFGSGNFLIPAMVLIGLFLCLRKEESTHD